MEKSSSFSDRHIASSNACLANQIQVCSGLDMYTIDLEEQAVVSRHCIPSLVSFLSVSLLVVVVSAPLATWVPGFLLVPCFEVFLSQVEIFFLALDLSVLLLCSPGGRKNVAVHVYNLVHVYDCGSVNGFHDYEWNSDFWFSILIYCLR